MSQKTSHQLARELLAGPDLPIWHFDPSFEEACTDEDNHTLGDIECEVVDATEGMDEEEVAEVMAEGGFVGRFIMLCGDQPAAKDRQAEGGA
jgi:hypothetical protein